MGSVYLNEFGTMWARSSSLQDIQLMPLNEGSLLGSADSLWIFQARSFAAKFMI
jgi:hypothetical protein